MRAMQQLLDRSGMGQGERLRDILSRLAEDQFHMVVLGQFKRGKSSLINAVVGKELLPTAAVPLTSVVTALRYGSKERALIRRQGVTFAEEIAVSQLPEYVTERGNSHNEKCVLSADIEVPAPFLRRGLRFIDTPGVGSIHEHNTVTTYGFLPQADAAIFVTSADAPLTDAELTFLDAIRQHVRKLFFVMNKVDQLNEAERAEAIDFTKEALATRLGVPDLRLYPISAREAIVATESGDQERLEASGLPALQSALAAFLSNERPATFLVSLLDRSLKVADEARFVLDLQQAAQTGPTGQRGDQLAEFIAKADTLEAERRALIAEFDAHAECCCDEWLQPQLAQLRAQLESTLGGALHRQIAGSPEGSFRSLLTTARESLRQQLSEQAQPWLRNHQADVERLIRAPTQEVQQRLAALVQRLSQEARAIYHVGGRPEPATGPSPTANMQSEPQDVSRPGEDDSAVGDDDSRQWKLPSFKVEDRPWLQAVPIRENTPWSGRLLPLPRLARRAALRTIEREVTVSASCAASALADVVSGYVQDCRRSLDDESGRTLGAVRRQIESALAGGDAVPARGKAALLNSQDDGPSQRAELDRLREHLDALRNALLALGIIPDGVGPPASHALLPPHGPNGRNSAAQSDHSPLQAEATLDTATGRQGDILRALEVTTCPICALRYGAVWDFMCHWQYTLATDAAAQGEFRHAGGFCTPHTWLLERVSSPQGLSSGYPPLVERVADRVRALAGLPAATAGQRLAELLPQPDTCRACKVAANSERLSAERLVAELATRAGMLAFERSHGLCVNHLRPVLSGLDDETAANVIRHQARRLTAVGESMQSYLVKRDALRRDLVGAHEGQAYREALILLVGEDERTVRSADG